MESLRSIFIVGLLAISFLLWTNYQNQYGQPIVESTDIEQNSAIETAGIPSNVTSAESSQTATTDLIPQSNSSSIEQQFEQNSSNVIVVKTDTFDIEINLVGGDIVKANLIKFPITQGANDSYPMLKPSNDEIHIAQSGLIGPDGTDTNKGRPKYQAQQSLYEITEDVLTVPLTWQSPKGIEITKVFTFTRDSHLIELEYQIINNTDSVARVQQFAQLLQTTNSGKGGSMFMPTFKGAAYSTDQERFEKLKFGDFEDDKLNVKTLGGWVGMIEHYFVSAWVPPQDQNNSLSTVLINDEFAVVRFTGESVTVQPNSLTTITSELYVGPKDQETLANIANGLDLTVDYGILWWLSQPLFSLLKFLHDLTNNWGVAIILITLIVKGMMYWLTKKQYESMAKMRNLTPKLNQIRDRYGDDRQKQSQAMMDLYKKEKVNPIGGCLPMLLQMPIFLALYWVLLESVELRHADFMLWITDLSVKDPWFVLPILTGLSMWFLQKLQPMTIQDPMQQKIMQIMPVMMGIFFMWFPAGLVLYWLISNLVTLAQAKMIYAAMEKKGLKAK